MAILPITAETFTQDHMKKLVRGVTVAEQALALAHNKLTTEAQRCEALVQNVNALEDSLADRPTTEDWTKLIDKIDDLQRGVISTHELYIYAKENR